MDRTRTSKLERKSAPPIRLTDRDKDIIMALHKYRFLTHNPEVGGSSPPLTTISLKKQSHKYAVTIYRMAILAQ